MGRKILFSFSLLFLCMGFSLTLDQIFTRKNDFKNLSKEGHLEKERGNAFSHHNPVNVSVDGISCILFWAKRITIKFKNLTWLDLTDEAFDQKAVVDTGNSNCSEESATSENVFILSSRLNANWTSHRNSGSKPFSLKMLKMLPHCLLTSKVADARGSAAREQTSFTEHDVVYCAAVSTWEEIATSALLSEQRLSLKFGDAENLQSFYMRFFLTTYNKLSSQSWFTLHRVEIIFNNSVQATFNVTGIYAPSSYSYHCQRVSSLQQHDALLLPSDTDDMSSLWEVTFIDFQIQGFTTEGQQFAKARDCTSSFSPAVLIGLAMSLILLLVLAYALHMLIYLRYLDRHYEFITSPTHFPPLKTRDLAEEKELLRSQGVECYELRSQQICKIYV
ncbi:V-type proton ATPase subunit S1-like protein [Callospermophilus lateralis]